MPRDRISTLRKELKGDEKLDSQVGKPPKSDKLSPRVDILVKANVHGSTEIELVESTIKFNGGVITGENHTGKLSRKTELFEFIRKKWLRMMIIYATLVGANLLLRIPELDYHIVGGVLFLYIPVTLGMFYVTK